MKTRPAINAKIITVRPDRLAALEPGLQAQAPDAQIFAHAGQADEIIWWESAKEGAAYMAGQITLGRCPDCGIEGAPHQNCPAHPNARGCIER